MRAHRIVALTVGITLLLGGCGAAVPEPDPVERARAEVEAVRADWETHYNLHHADMVADLYIEDAFVLTADLGVDGGRAAIEASLHEAMQASPEISVTTGDIMVFGDQAVTWGNYELRLTDPAGEPASASGAYLVYLQRAEDGWRLAGSIANYDSPRPAGWVWGESGEAPPEESRMTDLIRDYETHWNLQHPDMLADFYAPNAVVAFADGPVLHGRPAVGRALTEQMGAFPTTIDIHGVATIDLEDGWVLDAGWFELSAVEGDDMVQWGMYMGLLEPTGEGGWQIRWFVSNARPADGM